MLVVILSLGLVVCDQFFLMLQIDVKGFRHILNSDTRGSVPDGMCLRVGF